MIDYEKPLPLTQIAIKLTRLNLLIVENVKNAMWRLNVDFSFSTQPNLKFLPSVDAEMSEEEDRFERFEKGGV